MRAEAKLRRYMLAPMVTLLLLLTVYPTIYTLVISLTSRKGTSPDTSFIWLRNFGDLLTDGKFWQATGVTLVFTVAVVTLEIMLGLLVALTLHDLRREHRWLRALFLLPMAATPVAVLFGWKVLLDPTLGVLNYVLAEVLHLGRPDWLGTPNAALATLVMVDVWQWTPFVMVILFGGLAHVSAEQVEASLIDGASWLQRVRYIIVPALRPFLMVALLFRGIDALKTFDSIQVLTGGGPGSATTTLNMLAFREGLQFLNFGRGAAIALLLLVIATVFGKLAIRFIASEEAV
jgi:multiple sugar transport system permease protein